MVVEPSNNDLLDAVRVYLTLRRICEQEDANAVTINCGRFTEERPIVPCLAFAKLIDEGVMCGCEGDITAILSAMVLHAVSGGSVLMGNFGYAPGRFEAKEGEVTIEHDVIPLSMGKDGFIIRDYHGRRFGVTGYTDIREGEPVTLMSMNEGLDKITVIEGRTKYSEDGIHCRVIVHLDVDGEIERIPNILTGQHISMVFGRWLEPLREAAKILGLKVLSLRD